MHIGMTLRRAKFLTVNFIQCGCHMGKLIYYGTTMTIVAADGTALYRDEQLYAYQHAVTRDNEIPIPASTTNNVSPHFPFVSPSKVSGTPRQTRVSAPHMTNPSSQMV
jgi:hypothetical protein